MDIEKQIRESSVEQVDQSGMEERGRKMSGKSAGMMENDVTRTIEETREDADNDGVRQGKRAETAEDKRIDGDMGQQGNQQ